MAMRLLSLPLKSVIVRSCQVSAPSGLVLSRVRAFSSSVLVRKDKDKDSVDDNKKEDKPASKSDSAEGETSFFDVAAPRSEAQPRIFSAMAGAMEGREKETKQDLSKLSGAELEAAQLDAELDAMDSTQPIETSESEESPASKEDALLKSVVNPPAITALDNYLSPLEKAVYLKQRYGIDNPLLYGRKLSMKIDKKLIPLLEPNVHVKSNTLSGSVKKINPFVRSLRKMTVHRAIAHCHFNMKNIAREMERLLYRGIKEAKELGISEEGLYIDEIWCGKEKKPSHAEFKKPEYKARGRMGMYSRYESHVEMVLRTPETRFRVEAEKFQRKINRKPWIALKDKPFYRKDTTKYLW
ncbi:mitochondrial 54S ribosomal protein uL22m [Lipomyces oligophaga]|uniref:mitochondrial 54S ribosomal protein uL22m n=1 Tax=Lipomyces oligophaga TaxID=45792 RepID=UPI0034CD3644